MGIFNSDHPGHEGFCIGFVIRDGCHADSGLYRELGYPRDNEDLIVVRIAAGCECGWRSAHWIPSQRTEWSPFIVHDSAKDDERVHELWSEHVIDADLRGVRDFVARGRNAQAAVDAIIGKKGR